MKFTIQNYFNTHQTIFGKLSIENIQNLINLINVSFKRKKNIFVCGNGGSAYNASHFITDWNKMVYLRTGKRFKGISLCDNIGLITAYSNDVSYEQIFEGQLNSLFNKGDLVIGISVSGNSKNVIKALNFCNKNGGISASITGYDGGKIKRISQYNVNVPSYDMQICEDIHLMIGHMVMKNLCGSNIE
jgi:D-sedoheptulose 7-phosphate isomerase